eukprot:TRINITY_DN4726_c0_g1_i5.p1 TRINITY_DN4726_c0_g1~~TRINITY_DN4726_c0_g1_i5.p1  ORF type:complete len:217 (+),score=-3.05 TRINITY_DN4726_c0_g1_i5:225-875(+)
MTYTQLQERFKESIISNFKGICLQLLCNQIYRQLALASTMYVVIGWREVSTKVVLLQSLLAMSIVLISPIDEKYCHFCEISPKIFTLVIMDCECNWELQNLVFKPIITAKFGYNGLVQYIFWEIKLQFMQQVHQRCSCCNISTWFFNWCINFSQPINLEAFLHHANKMQHYKIKAFLFYYGFILGFLVQQVFYFVFVNSGNQFPVAYIGDNYYFFS